MNKVRFDILLAWIIGMTYAAGALNYWRYLPNVAFLPNTDSIIVLCAGLCLLLLVKPVRLHLNLSAYTWLALALLIIIQPFLHRPDYPDSLIFPLVTLLLMVLLSVCVTNISDHRLFWRHLAFAVLLVGILNALIQHTQLWFPEGIYPLTSPLPSGYPPYGNMLQRNEASFVNALALTSLLYLIHYLISSSGKHKKIYLFATLTCFVFLSIALGMGNSRIGILLPIFAIVGFSLIRSGIWKEKLLSIVIGLGIYALSYFIGAWLLQQYGMQGTTILGRIQHGELYTRWSLWQQSLMIFLDHPIFGSGWGAFAGQSMNYIDNLSWLAYSTHSHFFISQIGAEFGIIGLLALIPAGLSFLRATRSNLSPEYATAWAMALVVVLYSCTEYPLWYVDYLGVFVALLAFLDTRLKLSENNTETTIQTLTEKIPLSHLIAFICAVFCILGVYYHIQYKKIANAYLLAQVHTSDADLFTSYTQLPNPYGLSYAKEAFLFATIPVNPDDIEQKVVLGRRISSRFLSSTILFKQGVFMTMNHQPEQALHYFYASCLIDNREACIDVKANLQKLAEESPSLFGEAEHASQSW